MAHAGVHEQGWRGVNAISHARARWVLAFCLSLAELIRHINDPEHPLTLEQLNVAQLKLVQCNDSGSTIDLNFTPTIPVSRRSCVHATHGCSTRRSS